MSKMGFKKEYTSDVVDMIERVYGRGFLSQGGEAAAQEMLHGIELKNKSLLDIGCGLGAPTLAVARLEPTLKITGVDVDADLISAAKQRAKAEGYAHRSEWLVNEPEARLPFDDAQFDIIYNKESWLHIADKLQLFQECLRVLKPGGILVSLDWMHSTPDYSPLMKAFACVDGLTFHFSTLTEYIKALEETGFTLLDCVDHSAEHWQYAQNDVAFLTGAAKPKLIEALGEATYQAYLYSWEFQVKVFESREMQTYWIQAQKSI